MKHEQTRGIALGALAALVLGAGAHAQGSQDHRGQRSRQQQSGTAGEVDRRLEPRSWVAVGYDFDGDGRYDAVEYVFGYDLMKAREQSEERARRTGARRDMGLQGRQAREAGFRMDMSERARQQGRSMAQPATYRTAGEVRSLKRVELVGQRDPHVIATIRTEQGRSATVNLGPQPEVSRFDLKQGDRIEVVGTIGKTDGKAMLMADRVRHDGRTAGIARPDDKDLKHFQGTIQSVRKVQYRGLDDEHVQARVQLRQGATATVDLGAASEFQDARLSQGKQIEFLADSVRIDGQPGLRAEQVKLDGRKIDLDREQERQRLQRQQQAQRQQQQGSSQKR